MAQNCLSRRERTRKEDVKSHGDGDRVLSTGQ